APLCEDKRKLCNWIIKELFKLLNESSLPIEECPVAPEGFSHLINLLTKGEITDKIGRDVLEEMFKTGGTPDSIIKEKDLKPIADDDLLGNILDEVIAESPDAVAQIKAGETKPVDFLMGQVMKKTRGKADPKKVRDLILKELTE
ncbi:MAG: Asp-tRNA(Asn)/Glu-tRNA(Gln) amidotransferase GatCAB subunit B, partial [Deltaproteobacteria bacterium]|nr:Asp-tRNA(Asn)/Glu-tRNA(Gln) amidotransferase GatCAB subunit B [Deltaproteobacteria bacterium]